MAYRFRPAESARHGLRRLAKKALRSARTALRDVDPPTEEAVHAARKSVKRARAIFRLVEEDDGRGLAGAAKRLRRVNRRLSCVRDADAMIETLAALKQRHPELFSEHVYARLRRDFTDRKEAIVREAQRDGSWTEAADDLRVLQKAAGKWRPRHRGFGALEPGIQAAVRRARKAMMRAKKSGQAADFHEWRKAAKSLWYLLRLIGGGTAAVGRDIRALRAIQKWLGDDHNLVVLCAELSKDPTVCRNPLDTQRLRCAVDALQRALRRKSIDRVRALFAGSPRAYARRVERAWRAREDRGKTDRARAA